MLGVVLRLAAEHPLNVFEPITESAHQILAGFSTRGIEQLGVGSQVVGGRYGLEGVAGHEFQGAFIAGRDAGHARQGLLPPVGVVAISVRVDIEGPLRPGTAAEAIIASRRGQRFSDGRLQGKGEVIGHFGHCVLHEPRLRGRFLGQVQEPVPPGIHVNVRSQAARHGCQLRAQAALQITLLGGFRS